MTAPNPATLWGRIIADELAGAGVSTACIAPGSRSTPITVALSEHPDVSALSLLDERSASFFALGHAKRSGDPVAIVCTSGTAAAEFHPAVVEADLGRVPLIAVTADRPPELRDSGANQTIDQTALYGTGPRWSRTLPEPARDPRKLRMLRTTVARAVGKAAGTPAGPVHLNVPLRKPLAPTPVDRERDTSSREVDHLSADRAAPAVALTAGRMVLDDRSIDGMTERLRRADRGLIVAGPRAPLEPMDGVIELAEASGFPLLADPLSGLRFGQHTDDVPVCGGYDGYLEASITAGWPDPDLVLRVGAAPTSKTLRRYLARVGGPQLVIDPANAWRESTFTATDLVVADVDATTRAIAARLETDAGGSWLERFTRAERRYWSAVSDQSAPHEGAILARVVETAPDPSTVVVSNSMPVRDLDRFGRPRSAAVTVLGNRGASGIDGITSTALGAASATDDPVILVTGDLAFYHDMNGLLALDRCGVDATIVEINNDGGGIFHMLPIEDFDPPFTDHFKTPHGLDFSATEALYDLDFSVVDSLDRFEGSYRDALRSAGTAVVEVTSDAARSHRTREAIQERVRDAFAAHDG